MARFFKPGTIRAVIFSGRNNHDWRSTTPYLKQLLLRSGRFDVRVVEEPAGTTSATLAAYDVLVLDYNGPRWGEATEKAVEGFVKSGKGLVVIHGASYAFTGLEVLGDGHKGTGIREPPWPEYLKMIGGHPASTFLHDQELFIEPAASHPILTGVGRMHFRDETYKGLWISPQAQVLLKTDNPTSDGPLAWVSPYQKSRVVYIQLGHDQSAHLHAAYRTLVRNAILWTAGKLGDKH